MGVIFFNAESANFLTTSLIRFARALHSANGIHIYHYNRLPILYILNGFLPVDYFNQSPGCNIGYSGYEKYNIVASVDIS
ncbi:hypothetical protein FB551_1071 [Chryseobacterium aquifrigidense]|uniref:Uncharacterized protein n=1 Tax=Chryseobacterium aquifrigidense TaxID=558021 RepID=A0A543EII1_9FLAO|nr:hypothetical protein FB551_1071 [Chryseobacterium aquifrigidense]